jgi:hypothetical protein
MCKIKLVPELLYDIKVSQKSQVLDIGTLLQISQVQLLAMYVGDARNTVECSVVKR